METGAPDTTTGRTSDGVFSGGGIKGLAFAGALAATEEAGYVEWHELAGTSAGAIVAMTLAAGYHAALLRDSLDAFDFSRIADYGSPIRLLGEVENLLRRESLVEGDALTAWIRSLLDGSPITGVHADITFGELRKLTGRTLIVVGSDLAHGRLVRFPEEAGLYEDGGRAISPDDLPVYIAVRISAGFPYFFPPVRRLRDAASNTEGVFVDGGVGSAFPVYVFDKPQPQHPTWGFHLHGGLAATENQPVEHAIGGPTWPVQMLEAILDTAMNALDNVELQRFADRVVPIPTGAVSTLNFNLSAAEKEYLYDSGYKSAKAFFSAPHAAENSYGKEPAQQSAGA